MPPEKILKSTVFELEQWILHQNGPFFHQKFNGKGLWIIGSQFCTKKMKNVFEFQNSWNFWIFRSWSQPGAWHIILPLWSWYLSDTIHVRSHTKFHLIWAINTAFSRGGLNQPPPSLKCEAGIPSLLGLKRDVQGWPGAQQEQEWVCPESAAGPRLQGDLAARGGRLLPEPGAESVYCNVLYCTLLYCTVGVEPQLPGPRGDEAAGRLGLGAGHHHQQRLQGGKLFSVPNIFLRR